MANYELIEPFDISKGQLANVSANLAFCLGVEWQSFRERLSSGNRFTDYVLAPNAKRLARMAERHGRFVEYHDVDDQWSKIVVGDQFV